MGAVKTFKIAMSERCYRFKPDSIPSHAPQAQGVYEFVTFDIQQHPQVLYVGLALDLTIQEYLTGHLFGKRKPTAQDLFTKYPNVYFDYVARANVELPADWKDIAAELIRKNNPEFNAGSAVPASGRYAKIELIEE